MQQAYDVEWFDLIMEAKQLGITDIQLRQFFSDYKGGTIMFHKVESYTFRSVVEVNGTNLYINRSVESISKEAAELSFKESVLREHFGKEVRIIEVELIDIRQIMPLHIKKKMEEYRMGLSSLPKSYLEWHQKLAYEKLEKLVEAGYRVHSKWTASDGWGDGMSVVHAVVEDGMDNLYKIKWSDTNQGFMKHAGGGGWTIFNWGEKF